MTLSLIDRVKENKYYKKLIFPLTAAYYPRRIRAIHIEPTNACNLKCAVCFSQNPQIYKAREKGFMDFNLYRKVIDEICGLKYIKNVGLNYGGESLLHKEFNDMLEYAYKKTISTAFTTNGTLLTDKIIDSIVKYNVEKVIISIDAVGEKHNKLRSGSDIFLVEENVNKLIALRKNNKYPQISVNITQSTQNEEQIKDVIDKWINKVDSIIVYPCITEDLKYVNKGFFDKEVEIIKICPWPFYYMAILWNGDVTTCCHDINGVNVKGNVSDKGLIGIWKEKFSQIRKNFAKGIYDKDKLCSACETWKYRFKPITDKKDNININYSGISKTYKIIN